LAQVHMKLLEIFWDDVPYVVMAIATVGAWWRYRYDKFGWTTRSSQIYESRLLSIANPLFHFGSLAVIMGHIMGLFVPEWFTRKIGFTDHLYHLQALLLGIPAGAATLLGVGLLIYRRRTRGPVYLATTRNDKLMYLVLTCALVAGMCCTVAGATHFGELHDYRQKVSVWFRSIWILDPRGDLIAHAAFYYQIHVVIALALFALWPFTRLVHAFSAPFGYLFRPYIVYRSRDVAGKQLVGTAPRRRGW
jgi:nitrate reductase gamma subunit